MSVTTSPVFASPVTTSPVSTSASTSPVLQSAISTSAIERRSEGRASRASASIGQRRLSSAAEAAAGLPRFAPAEALCAIDLWADLPPSAPDLIVEGLHQGGTEDWDVLSQRGEDFCRRGGYPFDTVVTLYGSAQPVPWEVEELRFAFLDARMQSDQVASIVRASRFAFERWLAGAEVLIRCQAGVNRSGLVTALVLIRAGLTPTQAILLIRQQRGQACLFNEHFVEWLLEHGEAAVIRHG